MKFARVTLLSILIVAVHAKNGNVTEENPEPLKSDDGGENKSTGKRWLKNDGTAEESQSIFANKFARANLDSAKGQDRAVVEKTWRDFLPYDAVQNALVKILKPEKPLLDSAEPKELNTPNNGAGVEIIGEFIVKGSETLSRAINAVLDASIK
ncbi:hypothetical protein RUM44_004934 [Polyplax serrata]|uniref:RxLR effector protein n=1 Tax=Polyplax serrata TaxID=468196 RepID=A0ABR1AWI0_POLSC